MSFHAKFLQEKLNEAVMVLNKSLQVHLHFADRRAVLLPGL
jgi:hypothetical protein